MQEVVNNCGAKKHIIDLEDVIQFIREAERKGIKSYQISSFLD